MTIPIHSAAGVNPTPTCWYRCEDPYWDSVSWRTGYSQFMSWMSTMYQACVILITNLGMYNTPFRGEFPQEAGRDPANTAVSETRTGITALAGSRGPLYTPPSPSDIYGCRNPWGSLPRSSLKPPLAECVSFQKGNASTSISPRQLHTITVNLSRLRKSFSVAPCNWQAQSSWGHLLNFFWPKIRSGGRSRSNHASFLLLPGWPTSFLHGNHWGVGGMEPNRISDSTLPPGLDLPQTCLVCVPMSESTCLGYLESQKQGAINA